MKEEEEPNMFSMFLLCHDLLLLLPIWYHSHFDGSKPTQQVEREEYVRLTAGKREEVVKFFR